MDTGFVICYKLICPFFEAISAHLSLPRGYRQPRVPNATESWLSNNQPRRLVRPPNSDVRRVRLVIVIIIIQYSAIQTLHPYARFCSCAQAEEASGSFRFVKKKKKKERRNHNTGTELYPGPGCGETTVPWFQLRCVGTHSSTPRSRADLYSRFLPFWAVARGSLPLSCHGISARSVIPSALLTAPSVP